jgi:hypothetical protein
MKHLFFLFLSMMFISTSAQNKDIYNRAEPLDDGRDYWPEHYIPKNDAVPTSVLNSVYRELYPEIKWENYQTFQLGKEYSEGDIVIYKGVPLQIFSSQEFQNALSTYGLLLALNLKKYKVKLKKGKTNLMFQPMTKEALVADYKSYYNIELYEPKSTPIYFKFVPALGLPYNSKVSEEYATKYPTINWESVLIFDLHQEYNDDTFVLFRGIPCRLYVSESKYLEAVATNDKYNNRIIRENASTFGRYPVINPVFRQALLYCIKHNI